MRKVFQICAVFLAQMLLLAGHQTDARPSELEWEAEPYAVGFYQRHASVRTRHQNRGGLRLR